jgi:hypothetical protein
MSVIIPAYLAVDATRALAGSALPDAPTEPDRPRRRGVGLRRLLFRPATPARVQRRAEPVSC